MQGRIALTIVALVHVAGVARAASLTILPDPPKGMLISVRDILLTHDPFRLTPDGAGVVGVYGNKVFRWTRQGGYADIGTIPRPDGAFVWLRPQAISADGEAVVGRVEWGATHEVFRWTVTGGLQYIGLAPSPAELHHITAVSDDGSVVVGNYRSESGTRAFAWSDQGGLSFPETPSPITALSGDGTTIAGGAGWPPTSYVWTVEAGTKVIGPPAGEYRISATSLSMNGGVAVGAFDSYTNEPRAYRWSEAFGAQKLGNLGRSNSALAVSADGSVVVGKYYDADAFAERIFYWNEDGGMRPLHEVLDGLGVEMTPAFFSPSRDFVLDVSADGNVILGVSQRMDSTNSSQFAYSYWLADLSTAVPEPQAWALMVAAATLLLRLRGASSRKGIVKGAGNQELIPTQAHHRSPPSALVGSE